MRNKITLSSFVELRINMDQNHACTYDKLTLHLFDYVGTCKAQMKPQRIRNKLQNC